MKLIRLMTLASATFIAGTTFAISDTLVSPTEAEKIKTFWKPLAARSTRWRRARAACSPLKWMTPNARTGSTTSNSIRTSRSSLCCATEGSRLRGSLDSLRLVLVADCQWSDDALGP
jgi:hypothetical protein